MKMMKILVPLLEIARPAPPIAFLTYVFGDLAAAAWHTKFLAEGEVRRKTEALSLDRTSTFRGEFRLPLYKIEYLVSLFRERRWIDFSHHCRTEAKLKTKSELLILGALNVLAHGKTFRSLEVTTNISREEHRKFFHLFLDKMYSIRNDHIRLPLDSVISSHGRECSEVVGGTRKYLRTYTYD